MSSTTTHDTNKEATMKAKTAKTRHTIPQTTPVQPAPAAQEVAASTTPVAPGSILAQLKAIEVSCGYGDPLADKVRNASEALVNRVPISIVDRVIALAVHENGSIAGIAFDPNAAQSALSAADDADAVATAAQMLARRAQDQSIRLRAGIAGGASAVRGALRSLVKTPSASALASASDELTALAKQHAAARKARKTRAENAVKSASATASSSAEPTTPATTASTAPPPTAPKAS
jgi:hypothetical protein